MSKKIKISKKELYRLYYKEKKSKYKIGDLYNCSFKTVLNRMREFEMEPLSRSIIQSKYKKFNFSGDKTEKAYLIGFRLGDLNVYQTSKHSEVIVIRCHTTAIDQLKLTQDLFSKYGKVSYKKNSKDNSYYINCFVNTSFHFLLPKKDKVNSWISKNNNFSSAFAAGYIDAEGNLGVYDKKARFKIDSYDKNIIIWFYKWFLINNISCPKPKKIGLKNQIYNKKLGYKYNNNLWRIRVSKQESLEKLFLLIKPYLKHKNRIKGLNKCINNLYERRNNEN
ncbi:hypothetical protein CO115_03695 [Candidatus Falkowbacteria bacterium CG_4_9_14_3_um_filter_36_9]|uniref:Homing endonuclease LAGLIDADG domain-containing protein n=2 Tax=Patescibacteria group TaxID=1783273 RepID=A0A2M7DQS9_9BACT|nr:MAG: hypothetical protein COS18_00510 [Candidatus Falkowbacteria bacterium CG02_land_8_20_14_3_00_36_14]PIX11162.1 MAG: hypothetical protein COZ73_03355 [Candidatus Falkowbacteria bacterium CG_4_8_14_3_um_filter_36_11]PJA10258.1 MAG: hypothetical protein COX67_05040 [Candidatus Falkowbacteria bacterium CG_4_10_14_0_2_um_filter_36_22]PJB18828.1 MAG: hypothetical protein CO115_03695 [Candidatus Falkowbacteria bacterium CG_4_9_14_3_um_filter_36_9]